MNALFDELKEGLEEAIQHASGEPTNVRVRAVELPDVTAGRHALGMSHAELTSVPLRVIQREPDHQPHPQLTLDQVIEQLTEGLKPE